jgi:hypothetical protein
VLLGGKLSSQSVSPKVVDSDMMEALSKRGSFFLDNILERLTEEHIQESQMSQELVTPKILVFQLNLTLDVKLYYEINPTELV